MTANEERVSGRSQFLEKKAQFEGRILPEMDPDTVRVRMVLKDVVIGLHRGLRKQNLNHASESKVVKLATSHLEGLKWEVLVVKDDAVYACCLPGGKVVVITGLLERFKTDEEIATIIAHEVAHVVARHYAEWFTRSLRLAPAWLILYKFFSPDLVKKSSIYHLDLLFALRMAIEADYIGLLLLASAGYDPWVVPKVFEKLDQVSGDSALENYISTHPWGNTRSKVVYKASVMQKAISIYEEAITRS